MSTTKKQTVTKKETVTRNQTLFGRENYMWMLIAAALLTIGFFLMSGGKSADPNVFDANEVYSTVRITIAPLLIIAGFVAGIIAIMKKQKD